MPEQSFNRRDYKLRLIVDEVMESCAVPADKANAMLEAGVPMARVAELMGWPI